MALPQYDPTDDLENGLLSVPSSFLSLTKRPLRLPRKPSPRLSHRHATSFGTPWSTRLGQGAILVAPGAFILLVGSVFGYFLALCVSVGFFPPFGNLPFATGIPARAVGGVVVGGAVGLLGFVSLCTRRARMSADERRMQNRFVGSWCEKGTQSQEEPCEATVIVGTAVLLSAFGMVVGVALVPSLADAAQEHGFRLGHAVFLGLWGLTSAFLPNIVGCVRGPVWRLEGWSRLLGRGRRLIVSVVRTGRDECVCLQEMM